ncbi:MAG TPA: hypothetical protein VHY08_15355 [Bacillota bacterium]|nr:hypothetical protein [Bacillota bacterium]
MEHKIGHSFDSLAQRILYYYAGTFPKFIPVPSKDASEHSQEQMYQFMKGMVEKLYRQPELLNLPMIPDDSYQDWELQKTKPELIQTMRKYIQKIDEFYLVLFHLGELGQVKSRACARDHQLHLLKSDLKITGKMLSTLGQLGLLSESYKEEWIFRCDEYDDIFPAWQLLVSNASKNSQNQLLFFSRCIFDTGYFHTGDIFESLVNNQPAFRMLTDYFRQNGYERVDFRENEISLDWVKNYAKKAEPLKASWAERTHGGISIYYDYRKKNQIIFGLRVPHFKELLAQFAEMDDPLKELIITRTKKCDHCGYCTQTDKTGTRKPQIVTVTHQGEYHLCPFFPGFSYIWTSLDDKGASDIMKLLSFIDRVFSTTN